MQTNKVWILRHESCKGIHAENSYFFTIDNQFIFTKIALLQSFNQLEDEPMLEQLRTARSKNDYFESRFEPKPKPALCELAQAVEQLNQEISECDQEIERWQWKKGKISSQIHNAFQSIKKVL